MNPFGLLVVAIGALLVYGGAKGAGIIGKGQGAKTTPLTATSGSGGAGGASNIPAAGNSGSTSPGAYGLGAGGGGTVGPQGPALGGGPSPLSGRTPQNYGSGA